MRSPRLLGLGLFLVLAIIVGVAIAPWQQAHAVAPTTLNFQARLMTASGGIVPDGNYNVEFKLYTTATVTPTPDQGACTRNSGTAEATCLWTETRTGANVVTVKNGYLTVNLGSVNTALSSLDFSQQLYLAMRVGGIGAPTWDPEMSPRLSLTANAYAFKAGDSATLGGLSSSGFIQNTTTTQTNASLAIQSSADANITAMLQGRATQSVDLLQLKTGASQSGNSLHIVDSSNTDVFKIDQFGKLTQAGAAQFNGLVGVGVAPATGTALRVQAINGTSTGLTLLTGSSSQTADNLTVLDNSLNPIAGITGTGGLYSGRASNTVGSLKLYNATNANTVSLQSGTTSASYALTLPTALGSTNDCVKDTGSGVLGFSSCAPASGSANYIQNTTTPQSANLYVSAATSGSVAATLRANAAGSAAILSLQDGTGASVGGVDAFGNIFAQSITSNDTITANSFSTTHNAFVAIQNAASATVPVAVIKGGATPGAGADLVQLQNSSAQALAGFSNSGQLYLGRAGASGATGSLKLYNATNANTVTLQSGTTSAGYTLTLPTALSGVAGDCLKDSTGTGVLAFSSCGAASGTLQAAYTASSGGTVPEIKLDTTRGGLDIQDADTSISANLLTVRGSNAAGLGSSFFNVDATGKIAIGSIGTTTGQLYVSGQVPTGAVGSVSLTTNSAPQDLYVQGNYAYILSSSVLKIYDVTKAASPTLVGSLSANIGSFRLFVQGRYAYVISNNLVVGIQVIDISNPASPVSVSSLATGGSPERIFIQGRYAYMIDNGSNNLQVFDISNPAAIGSVGSITTGAGSTPRGLFVRGRYAYVVNNGTSKLAVFDISNPASPTAVGTPASTGTTAGSNGVFVQGRYAYVTNSSLNTMAIFDISSTTPVQVGSVSTGATSSPWSIFVQGRYAYVSNTGSHTIQVIDVADPAAPASVGTISTPATTTDGQIFVQGRYLYHYLYNGSPNDLFNTYDVGGSYIQQIEAGGIQTGTLATIGNASLNGDLALQGSAGIAGSLDVTGNVSLGSTVVGGANSTTIFQIQDAANASLFNADTTNNIIKLGNSTGTDTATTLLQLDSATADVTTSLSTKNGSLYYNSTSTNLKAIENGQVGTLGSWKFLGNATLGAGAANLDLTIPAKRHLKVEYKISGYSGGGGIAQWRFGAGAVDTAANYSRVVSANSAAGTAAQSATGITVSTLSIATGSRYGEVEIWNSSSQTKRVIGHGMTLSGGDTAASTIQMDDFVGFWSNTSQLTTIRLDGNGVNLLAGTEFSVWGADDN